MASYTSLATRVQQLLNDAEPGYEGTRWSTPEVIASLAEGYALLAEASPADFTGAVTHSLVPGAVQTVPANCRELVKLNRNVRGAGFPGAPVFEVPFETINRHTPTHGCGPCAARKAKLPYHDVSIYSVDPTNSRSFMVSPPVPPGKPATVELNCQVVPDPAQPGLDLPVQLSKYEPVVVEWALYRSFGIDTESSTFAVHALAHYNAFISNAQIVLGTTVGQQLKNRTGQR